MLNPTTAFANTQIDRHNSASPTEAYAQTSSLNPNPSRCIPYKRATFVYSDPTSYLDEYAFIASIPANVFRDETQNLYASPIIYGESKAGDYLLEDWKTYCNHWGGVSSLDFIGPYSDCYTSEMKSYLGTDNHTSIIADDPYEYAKEIALRDWTNTTTAVISPATTYFKTPKPIYGELKGEFFNVTEEYNITYWFGPKLGLASPKDLVPPVESLHPYPNGSWTYYYVTHPDAAQISVHFENISLQGGYDRIYIYDENYDLIVSYTGHASDIWTPPVSGDTIIIMLSSDSTISDWGFRADSYMWWTYEPPFRVIHQNEWLNFTMPANITGITIANVELLNWTSAVGETLLTCFLIDSDGTVVDYDFSPGDDGYAWLMWDINEHPRTTSENYTVAVYCHGFENPEDYGLTVGARIYGFSGKPGNLDIHTIAVPRNAEELDIWLSCNSTGQQASYLSMWLIDPEGNVFFPNYFEFTDTGYPPAPIYMSNIGRLNAAYPTPGNWTLIVEAPPPYSLDMTVEYTVQYQIRLYNKEKESYVEAAANSAVIASLMNAPLVYTENDALPEETVEALLTLNVQNVTLVDPAGMVSNAVKTAITEIGINITESLIALEETISYIRGLSEETDLILTVPTENFFAPAALAGAFHGAPVLAFKDEAKEILTLADSTWGAQYYYHEFWTGSYYDMLLKAPPINCMHQLSRIWSRWIKELDADTPGIESVLTIAPLTDVKPVFERAIAGDTRIGRMPGENAEEDVAFVNRAMLYPAIIYANPGYKVAMPTCVSYDYGIPDVCSDIPLDLVQPENYTVPLGYVYPVNSWKNTTEAMENSNFTVEPHVGKYTVLDQLNNGTAFWYHSDHGGLGFVNDYLPFGQGVIGMWYEDPPNPQPKRGYEYNFTDPSDLTTFTENAFDPDQYDPYGAVYQLYGEPFSFVLVENWTVGLATSIQLTLFSWIAM